MKKIIGAAVAIALCASVALLGVPAMANLGGATSARHDVIACANNTATAIRSTAIVGASEILVALEKDETGTVYIGGAAGVLTGNPQAITEGIQLCMSGCPAKWIKLPAGDGVFNCAGAGASVNIRLLGIE